MASFAVEMAYRLIEGGNAPFGMRVRGTLNFYGTTIARLPDGLSVDGDLSLYGTGITRLPEGLSVGGDLDLRRTAVTALPKGLSVGRRLHLDGSSRVGFPTSWFAKLGSGERWRALASDGEYTLIESDTGRVVAGCRGPWSRAKALSHWGARSRTDKRARRFAAALRDPASDRSVMER